MWVFVIVFLFVGGHEQTIVSKAPFSHKEDCIAFGKEKFKETVALVEANAKHTVAELKAVCKQIDVMPKGDPA